MARMIWMCVAAFLVAGARAQYGAPQPMDTTSISPVQTSTQAMTPPSTTIVVAPTTSAAPTPAPTTTAAPTSAPSTAAPSTTQTTPACCLPVNLPGVPIADPRQMAGVWYEYLYRTPGVDDINAKDNYTPKGCVIEANRWAVVVDWSLSYYLVAPGKPCVGIEGTMNITNDGRKLGRGMTFGITFSVDIAILYADPSWLEFYYACRAEDQPPNASTTCCANPSFWVRTRQDAATLTDAQKAQIQGIVDPILAPYCWSSSQLNVTAQDLSLYPRFCSADKPVGIEDLRAGNPAGACPP